MLKKMTSTLTDVPASSPADSIVLSGRDVSQFAQSYRSLNRAAGAAGATGFGCATYISSTSRHACAGPRN